jgi:starvation-inducible outer membrane lipoprotein
MQFRYVVVNVTTKKAWAFNRKDLAIRRVDSWRDEGDDAYYTTWEKWLDLAKEWCVRPQIATDIF